MAILGTYNPANLYDDLMKANGYIGYAKDSTTPIVLSKYTNKKKRNYQKKSNYEVIGLTNPALILQYGDNVAATTVKADFTTYPDRAILQFKNNTASDIFLLGGSIRGERILKISGDNGYYWEYSDYESIDRDGETFEKVESDYIINPVQCKQVGDYTWKESRPHKQYTLTLQGCQYNYEIGDVYSLSISYTLQTSTIENISSDVEIIGVTFNRPVDGVGTTELIVRVPSPTWALTTNTLARLVNAGAPTRLENRSNVVTVASSSWVGQADYFCDGTDDHVEIQKAIDYLNSIGGGTILLTTGIYNIALEIYVKNNIIIEGLGINTVLVPSSTLQICIKLNGPSPTYIGSENVSLRYFCIDGNNIQRNMSVFPIYNISYTTEVPTIIEQVEIKNFTTYDNGSSDSSAAIQSPSIVNNCYIHDCGGKSGEKGFIGIFGAIICIGNKVKNIYKYGGSSLAKGISDSKKCQQNSVTDTDIKYSQSYADSGTSNACADTADGGFNS